MSLSCGIAGNNQTLSLPFQPGPCCVPQMDTEQSPLKFTLENPRPHPHVTGLGRGALDEVVRSEGRAPRNGINGFIKVTQELASTLCSLPHENREAGSLQPGRGPSPEPDHAGTLILDFQSPEL